MSYYIFKRTYHQVLRKTISACASTAFQLDLFFIPEHQKFALRTYQ
jgi:hypothetical protein